MELIDAPHAVKSSEAAPPAQHKSPSKDPNRRAHSVFGASRLVPDDASRPSLKEGNTLDKPPDNEKLKSGDTEELPQATEEYLVTQMPILSSDIHVEYPLEAKKRGVQGRVLMDLLIDTNGKVRDVKIIETPDEDLGQAAAAAAKGFVFKPALVSSQAVAVRIQYAYRFVLER